jgi:hypothetical protein
MNPSVSMRKSEQINGNDMFWTFSTQLSA